MDHRLAVKVVAATYAAVDDDQVEVVPHPEVGEVPHAALDWRLLALTPLRLGACDPYTHVARQFSLPPNGDGPIEVGLYLVALQDEPLATPEPTTSPSSVPLGVPGGASRTRLSRRERRRRERAS